MEQALAGDYGGAWNTYTETLKEDWSMSLSDPEYVATTLIALAHAGVALRGAGTSRNSISKLNNNSDKGFFHRVDEFESLYSSPTNVGREPAKKVSIINGKPVSVGGRFTKPEPKLTYGKGMFEIKDPGILDRTKPWPVRNIEGPKFVVYPIFGVSSGLIIHWGYRKLTKQHKKDSVNQKK